MRRPTRTPRPVVSLDRLRLIELVADALDPNHEGEVAWKPTGAAIVAVETVLRHYELTAIALDEANK